MFCCFIALEECIICYMLMCFVMVLFFAYVLAFTQCTTLEDVNQFNSHKQPRFLHGILTIIGSNKVEPRSRKSRLLFHGIFQVIYDMSLPLISFCENYSVNLLIIFVKNFLSGVYEMVASKLHCVIIIKKKGVMST